MRTIDAERDPVLERFFDRAVGQITVPRRDAERTRRLRVVPLLGSAAVVAVVLIGALIVGRALNDARGGVAAQASASASAAQTTVERQPATLAQLPWETAVIDAFRSGGLQVRTIGASVAESTLGRLLPARSFIVRPGPVSGGFGSGADVIFVKGAGLGTITVCGSPGSAPGRMTYITSVGGQRVLSEDAVSPEYHLVSSDYFVVAYDTATRDALQRGLALVPPSCASPSPTQAPSATAVGFALPVGCSYAGAPVVSTGGSQWKFDCGSAANDNARGTLAPAFAAQGWTSCGVGLGSGTWMKGDLRLIVSEGSGGPAPAGLPTLTQPVPGVQTACG